MSVKAAIKIILLVAAWTQSQSLAFPAQTVERVEKHYAAVPDVGSQATRPDVVTQLQNLARTHLLAQQMVPEHTQIRSRSR